MRLIIKGEEEKKYVPSTLEEGEEEEEDSFSIAPSATAASSSELLFVVPEYCLIFKGMLKNKVFHMQSSRKVKCHVPPRMLSHVFHTSITHSGLGSSHLTHTAAQIEMQTANVSYPIMLLLLVVLVIVLGGFTLSFPFGCNPAQGKSHWIEWQRFLHQFKNSSSEKNKTSKCFRLDILCSVDVCVCEIYIHTDNISPILCIAP